MPRDTGTQSTHKLAPPPPPIGVGGEGLRGLGTICLVLRDPAVSPSFPSVARRRLRGCRQGKLLGDGNTRRNTRQQARLASAPRRDWGQGPSQPGLSFSSAVAKSWRYVHSPSPTKSRHPRKALDSALLLGHRLRICSSLPSFPSVAQRRLQGPRRGDATVSTSLWRGSIAPSLGR